MTTLDRLSSELTWRHRVDREPAHSPPTRTPLYGEGVMFLAPFTVHRFQSPWLPFHGILPKIVGICGPQLIDKALDRTPRTEYSELRVHERRLTDTPLAFVAAWS
ncbi:MAG: hypothetical protein ACT4OZ_15970 [Gemmatimonadota bacterium]